MRNLVPTVATIALLGVIAAGCGGKDDAEVVARVNQRPVTQRQIWQHLEAADDGSAGRDALNSLILHELIRQEAQKLNITADREEIESRLNGMKDYMLATTGEDFEAWLAQSGQSEQEVMNRISIQILTSKLVLAADDRQKYFETHQERLRELPHNNESVIFRQIVVASEEEAAAVYAELTGEGGADFAAVAEERSLDPMTRTRGGMAGWLIRGKSDDEDLEQALFTLEPGEVSKPLAVYPPAPPSGEEGAEPAKPLAPVYWRIIRVEKRIPPREITLEANADIIEEWMLKEPQFQMQLDQFFGSLRARADIEIVSPRYEAVGEAYQREREARDRRMAPPAGAVPVAPEMAEPPPSPEPSAAGE
jgi:parvulin-like peptidyl-prolyl isomerase